MSEEYEYIEVFDEDRFSLDIERDARRYNKAFSEEEEVRLI